MSDLMEACAGAGLDSSKHKPIAHAMPDGRIAVYIGAAYQYLPIGKALNLRDQLTRAIAEVQNAHGIAPCDAPERFDVQLRHWREGIRACPPMPEMGVAAADELERRAVEAMKSEAQS